MYLTPTTIREALELAHRPGARILAGGTDYFPTAGEYPNDPVLVDVTRVEELRGISRRPDGFLLGATTTWTDIVTADLPAAFDCLKAAAVEVGSVQIQNSATVAGNICNASPAADGVPPLLALNADVIIACAAGERRVPLAAFIQGVRRTALQPGEIVTGIWIPNQPISAGSCFEKLGSRKYLVISIAMVAAIVWTKAGLIEGARIAVGACSPVALRLPELEAALVGMPLDALDNPDLVAPAHLDALSPLSDPRGSAGYRLDAVAELCRRALRTAGGAEAE